MTIQNWSDDILVVELADDPAFTDELTALAAMLTDKPANVVINMAAVGYMNSSNIARLLRVRKLMTSTGRRLILCAVNNQVWGVFLVTGLDKIFDCTDDVATALATVQLAGNPKGSAKR
jgi:anti-anti-sigma factor